MWVKICANTNLADAQAAVDAGADAVGFVFASSPRAVTADEVATITSELPASTEKIGVFSTLDGNEIAKVVRKAKLTGVQLHGGFAPAMLIVLREEFGDALRIIQTNHWRVGGQVAEAFAVELRALASETSIDDVLVDSRTAVADGGTGTTFDWNAARKTLQSLGNKPLIVAGGLSPANVAQAITVLRPWGVDVASGVEEQPGKKDVAKVREFVQAAKGAAHN